MSGQGLAFFGPLASNRMDPTGHTSSSSAVAQEQPSLLDQKHLELVRSL